MGSNKISKFDESNQKNLPEHPISQIKTLKNFDIEINSEEPSHDK